MNDENLGKPEGVIAGMLRTLDEEQMVNDSPAALGVDTEPTHDTLTIPSWMSSIDRTKSMAHLEAISSTAKENLCVALTALEEKVQEMLTAIKEDS